MSRKKNVLLDKRANREFQKIPRTVQLKFLALFEILENDGKLVEPYGKKLSGSFELFEIRVKHQGQWRAIYAYVYKDYIIILSVFVKKTQKTPISELEKAKKRLFDIKGTL